MIRLYYFICCVTAIESFVLAGIVWFVNRHRSFGAILGLASFFLGIWVLGFAQYFRSLPDSQAMFWAQVTLTGAVADSVLLCTGMAYLLGLERRYRWALGMAAGLTVLFCALIWNGSIIEGLKAQPYLDHYVRFNRTLYPFLTLQIGFWAAFGYYIMLRELKNLLPYRRNQVLYLIFATLLIHVSTTTVIAPMEYNIALPPIGFLLLPFDVGMMCYTLTAARLTEVNLAMGRALVFIATLVIAALLSWFFAALIVWLMPDALGFQQIVFVVGVSVLVTSVFAIVLPLVSRPVERFVQATFAQERFQYRKTMEAVIRKASAMPGSEEFLQFIVQQIFEQMSLTNAAVFIQDTMTQQYLLQAVYPESPPTGVCAAMPADSAVVQWLTRNRRTLVADELRLREDAAVLAPLEKVIEQLQAAVCVPLFSGQNLVGLLSVGEKPRNRIFDQMDVELLESLALETGLALKYRQMEEQFHRKNKLIELGTIAAGVAHEIRNPLASIRTFAQLLPEKLGDPEFTNEFSKLVLKDIERITKVIESMLAFARPSQVTVATHAAHDLVEEAALLTQSRLKNKRIELSKEFHDHPLLKVDKQQILQVLINLINNAADVLPEHGRIRLATGVRWMEAMGDGGRPRQFGVIEVSDNGPGIPASLRSRLFDPFFTTKKDGTGLGLSISQKIVRDHGGIITVSSVEGKGTSFLVNLPLD